MVLPSKSYEHSAHMHPRHVGRAAAGQEEDQWLWLLGALWGLCDLVFASAVCRGALATAAEPRPNLEDLLGWVLPAHGPLDSGSPYGADMFIL